jgi:hypothetical protein
LPLFGAGQQAAIRFGQNRPQNGRKAAPSALLDRSKCWSAGSPPEPGQSGAGRRAHAGIDILQGLQQRVAVLGVAALGQTANRFASHRDGMPGIGERGPRCWRDGELQLTGSPQTARQACASAPACSHECRSSACRQPLAARSSAACTAPAKSRSPLLPAIQAASARVAAASLRSNSPRRRGKTLGGGSARAASRCRTC